MIKKVSIIVLALGIIILSGCQQEKNENIKQSEKVVGETTKSEIKKQTDHGQPYSKGPDSSPNMKGPSAVPPQAQAVTKNENIRLSLPLKTN